ncbi:MAG TPA: DUF3301 domain-containing protein [Burkholderiales bacterium]|jgi:hypothetical protein|nr:DUF3301 domain-containing protein [Burkholderiales bacterium]
MWEAAAILLLALVLVFWVDSLRARERALAAGRAACQRYGVQLLDETVAASALKLARDGEGRLRIRRVFSFEFSDTGNNRRHGSVVILGAEVQDLQLEPYPIQ